MNLLQKIYTIVAILFQTAVSAQIKNQITREPYLQAPSGNTMTVRWRTNFLTRSTVFFGENEKKLDQKVDSLVYKNDHIVTLTGLKPNTKYYYKVGIPKDTLSHKIYSFKTFPADKSADFSFAVFVDPGSLGEDQRKVRDAVLDYYSDKRMDFWLQLGDNAYNHGTDEEFQNNFFEPFGFMLSHFPSFSTLGNHDYHDVDFGSKYAQKTKSNVYFKIFTSPTNGQSGGVPSHNPSFYSFDIGTTHIISLDSYAIEPDGKMVFDEGGIQYQWLIGDLEAYKNHKGFKIVYTHFPPFSKGTHDSDTESIMVGVREKLIHLFDKYGIDLVLSGHSHVYERSGMLKGFSGKSAEYVQDKYELKPGKSVVPEFGKADTYRKKSGAGTVYVVTGNSSATAKTRYRDYPHKVMKFSNDQISGACIVDIKSNRLTVKWITENNKIEDAFVIQKEF